MSRGARRLATAGGPARNLSDRFRTLVRVLTAAFLSAILYSPCDAHAQTEYRFDRMWPALEQPWYFSGTGALIVDSEGGYIYVWNASDDAILKMSRTGQYIATIDATHMITPSSPGYADTAWALDGNGSLYLMGSDRVDVVFRAGARRTVTLEHIQDSIIEIGVTADGAIVGGTRARIYRWTNDGALIDEWSFPYYAEDIAVDSEGFVYATDGFRLDKFSPTGEFILSFPFDPFSWIREIRYLPNRNIIVAWEYYDSQIYAYSTSGVGLDVSWIFPFTPIAWDVDAPIGEPWQVCVPFAGVEWRPWGAPEFTVSRFGSDYYAIHRLGVDAFGTVTTGGIAYEPYDPFDSEFLFTLKRFSPTGVELSSVEITEPLLAVRSNGQTFEGYSVVRRYSPSRTLLATYGTEYTDGGEGQIRNAERLWEDNQGNVYIHDNQTWRTQKFALNGSFIEQGAFYSTVDSLGRTYGVMDRAIQIRSSDGDFLFDLPFPERFWDHSVREMIVNADGSNIFVILEDWDERRTICRVSPTDNEWYELGMRGVFPGQFISPNSVALGPNEELYVADGGTRVIKLKEESVAVDSRAIVVAAGGPFPGNVLWDATQSAANFAVRSLAFQGFTKDRIQYLSSDTQLDLDQNGVADDVDSDATNENLASAVQTWASGTESLLVYLVDHGGADSFRMSESETLMADQLGAWLDAVDPSVSGKITILYDACLSGSFLNELSGPNRIVVTSASAFEDAKFISTGTISFSNFFWEQIFNGNDINTAFTIARQAMAPYQTAQIDADGDGTPNEAADLTAVTGVAIGNGTNLNLFRPTIAGPVGIDGGSTLSNGSTATIFAENVVDPNDPSNMNDDGSISRVWAVLRPPNFTPPSPDNPVTNFPIVELLPVGGNRFEGSYSGFTTAGTYNIVVYALDNNTETSLPQLTSLAVQSPLRKKAIIAVGTDPASLEWPVAQEAALEAYETLQFQQYADSGPNEDIKFYSPVTFSSGVDGTLTQNNLEFAINTWAATDTQDLVIYLIGPGDTDSYRLNSTEDISASTLDGWLDSLQSTVPGVVTLLYDGPKSGSFRDDLLPPVFKQRIFIASTNDTQAAAFVPAGAICFSRFFWRDVANGATVGQAFATANLAINGVLGLQTPGLDDNANGVVNEKIDGPYLARRHNLGTGIVLAGDAPLIAGDSGNATINSGTSANFGVGPVTTTGSLASVWAMIMPPGYSVSQPERLETVSLIPWIDNSWVLNYSDFIEMGDYTIAVFAEDVDGVLSLPRTMTITQPSDQFTEAPTAEQLRNNFASLDSNDNGALTLAEAQALIPGLTANLFNQLDDDSNGLLSMAELLDASIGDPGVEPDVYIDFAFAGVELGTPANPFNSAAEAAAYAAAPGTLHFTAGTTSESPRLDRAATLISAGGTVTIGAP